MSPARAAAGFELDRFLLRERRETERALGVVLADLLDDVPGGVAAPIRYAVEAGGKRLRPILCVAAFRAAGGDAAAPGIRWAAAALELLHTYSLVHDDLPCMDDDDLRRGRPATHRAFGGERATVAGAALIPIACLALDRGAALLDLPPAERSALLREFCVAAGASGMVGGQLLDLHAEGRPVGLEELESIHRRKTGALLAAALRIGARAARARPTVVAALDDYGRALGLAFQVADDLLDVTGQTDVLGKPAGRDRDRSKATFPALLGVDGARERARSEAATAVAALHAAAIDSPELEALAVFAVERDR